MSQEKIGNLGHGGQGESAGHKVAGESSSKELWLALRAELDDLRAKYAATLAKLDADAGVTDTNYGALGALATKAFIA
jgi:hypothetical protein